MKKNIGTLDALIRLSSGFTFLGYGIIKKSRPLILWGSVKIAEGITRWCPTSYFLGISTTKDKIKIHEKV